MKNVIKDLNRSTKKYEKKFQRDFLEIRNEIDFHIQALTDAITYADEALDSIGEEISEWCDILQELYEVDDANTILQKIDLWRLKIIANNRYATVIDEAVAVQNCKERLQKLLNRLLVLKCCR